MQLAKTVENLLEKVRESSARLSHLGRNHSVAVTLIWIFTKEVLVVGFSDPKIGCRHDLGNDAVTPNRSSAPDRGLKARLLAFVLIKHCRPILGADVVTLPVQLPWVVNGKKDIEDVVGRNNRFVKDDLGYFCVTRVAIAHGFVGWVCPRTTHVTDLHVSYSVEQHVRTVEAPEAPTAKNKSSHVASLCFKAKIIETSSMSTRNPALGAALALSGALLFGLNASTSKVLIQGGIDPSVLVLFRSISTAVLAAIVLLFTNRSGFVIRWREVPRMLTFGVIGVALMQWAYSQAVSNLQVGVALLIEYTAIIWVPLVSLLIFKRQLRSRIWLAVALVLCGLVVVSNIWNGGLNAVGVVYAFLAAAFLTLYFIMGERLQQTRDTMSTLMYSMAVSSFFWLAFSPWLAFETASLSTTISLDGNFSGITMPLWVLLAWLGVFGSFVPMALSYRALHHLSATGVGIASTAETVFAFAFGFLWLNEQISGTQLLGGLLVLTGIILAQTARPKTQ